MKPRFELRKIIVVIGCLGLLASTLVARKYRREVLWPRWVESRGGYVNRVHDEVVTYTANYHLSMTRSERQADGTQSDVAQPAYFPTTRLRSTKNKSGDLTWSVFCNSKEWAICHVALPISAVDDATVSWLNSIHTVKYVTLLEVDTSASIPPTDQSRRLKTIYNSLDAELLGDFMWLLEEDKIVYE